MRLPKAIDVPFSALLLGLFPALFLPVLQLMLLILLVALGLSFRTVGRGHLRGLLTFPNIAIAQFALFFLINAVVFDVMEGNRPHFRSVAIESWSITLLCLGILALWLRMKAPEDVKRALIWWLPVGLSGAFLIGTFVYIFGDQGTRIAIFTPSPLTPPLWFLVLTMCSFTWFFEMSRSHKVWRICLFFMAGLMVVYGSARLVMLAWMICGLALAVWIYMRTTPEFRTRVLLGAGLILAVCGVGIVLTDMLAQGRLVARMTYLLQVDWTYDSISARFPRLSIWTGALSVIAEHPMLGIGNVNERLAINQELDWEKWFRAHQSYLSFLIAGGIPALLSGLILQSSALAFIGARRRAVFYPAFLGLGVVVTMNCLTDSIFQSAVNVQMFMVATLVFLRASDAD